MAYRRLGLTGLLLTVAFGLAGCGSSSTPAAAVATPTPSSTASSSPDDPAAELAAAAARLADDTARVRVAVTGQMTMTGVLDPRAQAGVVKVDMGSVDDGTQAEIRKLGADTWIKLRGPVPTMLGGTGQWMHVADADLPAESSFDILPGDDPAGVGAMIAAMTGVKRTGPLGFAGTVDLARSPRYSAA